MLGNKKGLSDVVTTLLIILVAVAAVAIIGTVVLRNVQKAGTQIDVQQQCQQVILEPVSCDQGTDSNNPDSVFINRKGQDTSNFLKLRIIVENSLGGVTSYESSIIPAILETKKYTPNDAGGFTLATGSKVSVAAILRGDDGKDTICEPSTIKATCT